MPTDKGMWKIVQRTESLLEGKRRFQLGSARVAFLSTAASTGFAAQGVWHAPQRHRLELPTADH